MGDYRSETNPTTPTSMESVQCFGRKKTAVAVCHCKRGKGLVKLNGKPLELVEPEILKFKAFEPLMLLGKARYSGLDLRVRVKSGGHVSQMYAVRQAIAKAIVAYYQKYFDEATKKEIKDTLLEYDRTLLSLTLGGASQRSSEEEARELGSRSL